MAPAEALALAAQVAVTLAGFAGVVVVFRSGSVHEWSPIDRFRLRLLLANSASPLAFCLFGSVLLSLNPPPAAIWRWCSALLLFFLVVFGAATRRGFQALPQPLVIAQATRMVFYPFAILGTTTILLQVYNAAIMGAFWPFYSALVFQLMGAIVQFARFILLPPHPD